MPFPTANELSFGIERKFLLGPGLREDIYFLASDIERLTRVPVRKLAALRKQGRGPRFEIHGRVYLYSPSAVIEWLNEMACS